MKIQAKGEQKEEPTVIYDGEQKEEPTVIYRSEAPVAINAQNFRKTHPREFNVKLFFRENKNVYRHQSPLFSKKAMPWGKKWPVQMNLPFFAVKAYVPGGGPESGRKKFEKCLPAGTGTKIYFSSFLAINSQSTDN